MVHSMLFTNCVKEQCYQEEEDTSKQTHTHVQAETHAHKCTQKGEMASEIQKKCSLQGQPFAGLSNWRLIIQVVINIKAGDNMGRMVQQPQESSRTLPSFCSCPPVLIYKHLPGTISLSTLHSAYIPRNFK